MPKGDKVKSLWERPEYRKKQTDALKKKWQDPNFKKKMSGVAKKRVEKLWNDPEYREMMSKKHKGYVMPKDQKEKISQANTGKKHPNRKKISLEDRLKKSESMKGEKHFAWKGGLNRFRGSDWSMKRKLCYERDNWTCQICKKKCVGKSKRYKKRVIAAHHLDLNCKNHELNNLITLCRSCHIKLHSRLCKK